MAKRILNIFARDNKAAVREDCRRCIVAIAVNRCLGPGYRATIGIGAGWPESEIVRERDGALIPLKLPAEVYKIVDRFDAGENIEKTSIEIEVPDEAAS